MSSVDDLAVLRKSRAYDQALSYANGMRTHGITDFPDPDSNGQIDLKGLHPGPGSDLDLQSSRFHAAQKACLSLHPIGSAAGQHQDAMQVLGQPSRLEASMPCRAPK